MYCVAVILCQEEDFPYSSDDEVDSEDLLTDDDEVVGYKIRDNFTSDDQYARYVRDNIRVDMSIRCRQQCDQIEVGDLGTVAKVAAV